MCVGNTNQKLTFSNYGSCLNHTSRSRICIPGKIIIEAPIAQLFPTTAPNWFVPVSTKTSSILYFIFFMSGNTFVVVAYPPNERFPHL